MTASQVADDSQQHYREHPFYFPFYIYLCDILEFSVASVGRSKLELGWRLEITRSQTGVVIGGRRYRCSEAFNTDFSQPSQNKHIE